MCVFLSVPSQKNTLVIYQDNHILLGCLYHILLDGVFRQSHPFMKYVLVSAGIEGYPKHMAN